VTLPTHPVPPLHVLSNHLRVVLLVCFKVVLSEGVELGDRLLLRDGERIEPLLLAAVVLKDWEVVPLYPQLALVPARIFYDFSVLPSSLSRRRRRLLICYFLIKPLYPLQDGPVLLGEPFL